MIREVLGYARIAKEAIRIVKQSKVKVDGVVRRDHRFPVGIMDVIQIQGLNQNYRVMPSLGGGLTLSPIDEAEAGHKLCRIIGKRSIDSKRFQISLHDGRNLLVQVRETVQKADQDFRVGGSLQLSLPTQKIGKYVPFQVGVIGLVVNGRNQGLHGKVTSISPGTHARPKIARIETAEEAFETPAHYVIPVGTETPLIALGK